MGSIMVPSTQNWELDWEHDWKTCQICKRNWGAEARISAASDLVGRRSTDTGWWLRWFGWWCRCSISGIQRARGSWICPNWLRTSCHNPSCDHGRQCTCISGWDKLLRLSSAWFTEETLVSSGGPRFMREKAQDALTQRNCWSIHYVHMQSKVARNYR